MFVVFTSINGPESAINDVGINNVIAIDDEKHANNPSKKVKLIPTGTIRVLCSASDAELMMISYP